MQRKIKLLRGIVLVLFLGFVSLIALCYSSTSRRERLVSEPVAPAHRENDRPQLISEEFEDTQTIGGRIVSRIRARRTTQYKSGWYLLENVHVSIYRLDGKTYELHCPHAEFHLATKEAIAKGGVRITSSDGVEIRTEELKFDGNRLVNRIPVEFSVQGWSGTAGGLELNVEHETLRLIDRLRVHHPPAVQGEPTMALAADEATFFRKTSEVTFRTNVVLQRGPDLVRAAAITARMDEKQKKLTSLAGDDDVVIRLVRLEPAGQTSGEVTITSDSFFGTFDQAGALTQFLTISATRSRAVMPGPPPRELEATQFRLVFAGGTPTSLHAEGNVVMKETGSLRRTVRANTATLFFDPATRKATNGIAEGNVEYDDGRSQARAKRANFDIASDRVILTAHAGTQPSIVSDSNTIKGNIIEIMPEQRLLKATGAVMAHLVPGKGSSSSASASGTAIFPGGSSPVFVNADSLTIRHQTQSAVFAGSVRAWQETNTLFANELTVQGAGDVVQAKTNVRVTLYNTKDRARQSPVFAKADVLTARKNDQKVILDGKVRIEDEGKTLSAETTTLEFGSDRKLERVEAARSVVVTETASSREGSGDKAVYEVVRQTIVLNGSPAVLKDPRGSVKGQKIVFDLERNKVDVTGTTPSETTYNPPS